MQLVRKAGLQIRLRVYVVRVGGDIQPAALECCCRRLFTALSVSRKLKDIPKTTLLYKKREWKENNNNSGSWTKLDSLSSDIFQTLMVHSSTTEPPIRRVSTTAINLVSSWLLFDFLFCSLIVIVFFFVVVIIILFTLLYRIFTFVIPIFISFASTNGAISQDFLHILE